MALQRKRPTEDLADKNGVAPEPTNEAATPHLPTFGGFDGSADLDKTTLDLDAFAPYKPTDPAAVQQSAPGLHDDPGLSQLDDVTDFSKYTSTDFAEAGAITPSFVDSSDSTIAEHTPSQDLDIGFSSDWESAPTAHRIDVAPESVIDVQPKSIGRLFVQIGKFSASYYLDKPDLLIGRVNVDSSVQPDISIEWDDAISRKHAHVYLSNESVFIEDLGSTNGTKVNGLSIAANSPYQLIDGDVVHLGSVTEITYYQ